MTEVINGGLLAEMGRHGHNQNTIAKVLNLSQSGVSQRILGKRSWKQKEINALCDYYNKTYEELFR